jgi:hypothetical protein
MGRSRLLNFSNARQLEQNIFLFLANSGPLVWVLGVYLVKILLILIVQDSFPLNDWTNLQISHLHN